jgi:hypothetical protein
MAERDGFTFTCNKTAKTQEATRNKTAINTFFLTFFLFLFPANVPGQK